MKNPFKGVNEGINIEDKTEEKLTDSNDALKEEVSENEEKMADENSETEIEENLDV